MTAIDHGTYAGYQQHQKAGERVCVLCTDARNAYMRDYRRRNPETLHKQNLRRLARERALRRLADQHPDQFAALLEAETSAIQKARRL